MTKLGAGSTTPQRLISLDVLRGITIAFMIMVNNNGGPGSWGFMNHAQWNGLTATDLVFPTFVLVVGAAIAFSYESRLKRGATRAALAWHTVKRAVILSLFGIVVNSFPFFALVHMRFYGVPNWIAVCSLALGVFYLWDRRVWTKVAALVVALVGYWVLVRWVPVRGAGMPGREIPFMAPSQNLVSWLDQLLLTGHLDLPWTTHDVRDPEGLLSDLPAIGTALIGLLTGLWLRGASAVKTKAAGLAAAAIACLGCGYLWSLWFPLNKNMWTSSYVLVAAGYSLALLTVVFWMVEVRGWRAGWTWPWLVFGSNAIVAYMTSELLPAVLEHIAIPVDGKHESLQVFLSAPIYAHISNAGWAAFTYSVTYTAVCFVPVWELYRKKIFLKV